MSRVDAQWSLQIEMLVLEADAQADCRVDVLRIEVRNHPHTFETQAAVDVELNGLIVKRRL